jgi:sulfite reductase (NADPH) flavoprotein alpha-component
MNKNAMTTDIAIPCLPENAPFTSEQRAYLNGYLAGLFSGAPASAGAELAGKLPSEKGSSEPGQ